MERRAGDPTGRSAGRDAFSVRSDARAAARWPGATSAGSALSSGKGDLDQSFTTAAWFGLIGAHDHQRQNRPPRLAIVSCCWICATRKGGQTSHGNMGGIPYGRRRISVEISSLTPPSAVSQSRTLWCSYPRVCRVTFRLAGSVRVCGWGLQDEPGNKAMNRDSRCSRTHLLLRGLRVRKERRLVLWIQSGGIELFRLRKSDPVG